MSKLCAGCNSDVPYEVTDLVVEVAHHYMQLGNKDNGREIAFLETLQD